MELNIKHDKEYQQFTARLGEEDAELAYATPSEEVMDFTHTYVPESARGKGVANKLIEEGLCYAEENGKKVVATCPVVKKFIDRNSNYQKLLQQ
ncbi:GNAT family N-acetyltransferase [Pontibacter sp. BT731]|uniref:GNAT family N-acetyltransferase n=1 Tax=Pontibacter coccineus TaxID=3063328 RepID=UPI0026E28227|nr:GNAT family N-acetyltransferase [Pontibacter sp. BT731]MDO6390419.1 GNAT family N-acetyltransferase [Pontibacter sp. BT731]